MTQKITVSIIAGIVVGLMGSYLMYHKGTTSVTRGADVSIATSTSRTNTATSTGKKKKLVTVNGITFETDADNPGGITFGTTPLSEVPKPIPALNTAVTFVATANVSPEAQKIIRTQIADLVKKLTANPGVYGDWLSLGLYRKMAGENALAKEAWEYAKRLQPNDKQAYSNLGDLYQYYLKDLTGAEINLKKTVELDATYIAGYRNLYDLYTQEKQINKAKAILDAGLSKNPHSVDLLVLLANYYKAQGNNTQAKAYFTKALTEAKVLPENASLVPVIQAEIDKLK